MSDDKKTPGSPTIGAKKLHAAALTGIALPLAAFDAIHEAGLVDDTMKGGKSALPASRAGAIDRARHVMRTLEEAGVPRPDTFVVAKLPGGELAEAWHSVPLYPVQFGDGRMMKAVVDPFLRRAPLGLLDWQGQLGVPDVELVAADEVAIQGVDDASSTMLDPARLDVTTKRGGTGTADDSHGLAKLLRAWLRDPADATQVERFRHLFGEVAWRSLQSSYPKLMQQVELALRTPRQP